MWRPYPGGPDQRRPLTRGGQERGLTGERPTVLLAHGPGRGQRPVDEVAALVVVGAAARVEQGGVSVPLHSEQARTGQVAGHGHGALVRGRRVVDIAYDQYRVGGGAVPRPEVTGGVGGQPGGTGLVKP